VVPPSASHASESGLAAAGPGLGAGSGAAHRSLEDERRIASALALHFETVWRSLRRFGVSESLADDAAQRVFLAFADRLSIVETGRERPYLIGIAVRVAANLRRQQLRLREEPSEDLDAEPASARDPETLLVERQRRQRLDLALGTLPELQREIFVLYELEGFSIPEIASALEIPVGTAASRLRRAREAFAAWVQQHLSSEGEA
jgi:RNA polymerase sigma-70 factor, ECF subfamily